MKRICESIQDVRSWLLNDIVAEVLDLGSSNSAEVASFVVRRAAEDFPDEKVLPYEESAVVLKVLGSEMEPIDSDHSVVAFNGEYFDYTATQYNDEFSDLITEGDLPVVQKIIASDRQVNQGVSTIKSYALLRNSDV